MKKKKRYHDIIHTDTKIKYFQWYDDKIGMQFVIYAKNIGSSKATIYIYVYNV